jgi:hypothetical protein
MMGSLTIMAVQLSTQQHHRPAEQQHGQQSAAHHSTAECSTCSQQCGMCKLCNSLGGLAKKQDTLTVAYTNTACLAHPLLKEVQRTAATSQWPWACCAQLPAHHTCSAKGVPHGAKQNTAAGGCAAGPCKSAARNLQQHPALSHTHPAM